MTFILVGGMTILLALLAFWVLGGEKKKEEDSISVSPSAMGIFQSLRLILGSLAFWQFGVLAFFRYGTFVGLQGLWLGPYLIHNREYSPVQAGNVLILLAIGTIVGGPIAGQLSDRIFNSGKVVALGGMSLYGLSLFPLIGVFEIPGPLWYGFLFFFIGFFNSFGMVIYSHAKDLFPITISGTVMTLVNFFAMAGAAIYMPAMGKIIDSFPRNNHSYPSEAYHTGFLVCFLGMVASVLFYAFSRKE